MFATCIIDHIEYIDDILDLPLVKNFKSFVEIDVFLVVSLKFGRFP